MQRRSAVLSKSQCRPLMVSTVNIDLCCDKIRLDERDPVEKSLALVLRKSVIWVRLSGIEDRSLNKA
jgi:hypothetical protein